MSSPRGGIPLDSEEDFHEAFIAMKIMVEELYYERNKSREIGPFV